MQEQNDQSSPRTPGLLRLLIPLLGSDYIEVLVFLIRMIRRVFSVKVHEGMYEALDYEASLELNDVKGEKATYSKHEKVRFLQDNIIVYQDGAWGDGDIFADYHCSPGVPVDRYRDGNLYRILISLRETKHRNDVEEFHIERVIKNGFKKATEDFQTDIEHTTRKLTLRLIFPRKRLPQKVWLLQHNSTRSKVLDDKFRRTLPDGRMQVTWTTDKPVLFESYMLRWQW